MNTAWRDLPVSILGLGKTGASLLAWAHARAARCTVYDTRPEIDLTPWQARYPDVLFRTGPLPADTLLTSARVLCSPGISPQLPALAAARKAGIPLWGDVELFAQAARAPIVAITGSNGKSTVTTLVGEMARAAGWQVAVGGNLGTPALDLLPPDGGSEPDLYVLELSSFQLEYTETLHPRAATILNLSPDHLDWHGNYQAYGAAKQRIFRHQGPGDTLVLPADDADVLIGAPEVPADVRRWQFGAGAHDAGRLGQDSLYLHDMPLLPLAHLRIPGRHNQENALAAALLADAVQVPREAIVGALEEFSGLPHRLQWIARRQGVDYYDDSKGTNLGATLRAMEALPGPLVMILGGDAKGADLSPLASACTGQRGAVLLGRDGERIAKILDGVLPLHQMGTASMAAVVEAARAQAQPGDQVLLSPACASLDMFKDYQDRGRQFAAAVQALEEHL